MNKPVILILNAGGPVELTDILEQTDNIKGILNISQLGQEGGDALADVLLGKEVPSGKLTTTWAIRGLSGFRRVWVSEWQSGKGKIQRRYLCRLQIF